MSGSSDRASVLLVDDEAHVTEGLSRHFPRQDYEVLRANSAAQAYELLAQRAVDVVVSDERMPGESGTEFLANVRQRYPNTIRMVLSGQASLEAAVRAINEGEVYRFLLKPCNPIDLILTIQQALQHRHLAEQSRALLLEFQRQAALLETLQSGRSTFLDVQRDATGALLVDESAASDSLDGLLKEMERCIASAVGS